MTLSYSILSVFAVDLLATSGDITLSWTSPMFPKLYSNDTTINPLEKPITEFEDAWLGSLLNMAAIIGSFPFILLARKAGRKIALLAIAFPHFISFSIYSFARNIYLFYLGRILNGLAIGGSYAILPMYIAEISKSSNRGAMTQTLNVFWAIGNFLPYALGPFLSVKHFNMFLMAIPMIFFIIFFLIGSESPHYLISANKIEQAETVLMKLRGASKDDIQEELYIIKSHLKIDEGGSIVDIIRNKTLLKTFIMCTLLVMTQEFSGFCAIMYHLQLIFEKSGSKIDSNTSSLIVGVAIITSSLLSPFLVDRSGRRILIIISCFGMTVALTCLGLFFYILDADMNTKSIFWLPIFSLILYIFSFNFGICCVPWTIVAEIFPSHVKDVAASTISGMTWITSAFTTSFFNTMNEHIGRAGTFWVFASFSLASGLYSIVVVPETKGKSLAEIQEMLKATEMKRKKYRIEEERMLNDDGVKAQIV